MGDVRLAPAGLYLPRDGSERYFSRTSRFPTAEISSGILGRRLSQSESRSGRFGDEKRLCSMQEIEKRFSVGQTEAKSLLNVS